MTSTSSSTEAELLASSPRTDQNGEVSDALTDLYREARHLYEEDEQRHVEPQALTEYLLVVADRLIRVRDEERDPIHASEIRRELSRAAKNGLSGKGGPTECHVSRNLLTRESQNERYFENGEWKFANHGPTIYELGYYTKAAYKECADLLDGEPAEWAATAATLVEEDDDSELSALIKSTGQSKSREGNGREGKDRKGEGKEPPGGEDRDRQAWVRTGGDPSADVDNVGTTGLDNNPLNDPEHPASERSDRSETVDIWSVNPPVNERCNRQQWAWLTRTTKSIHEQWVVLDLINSSRVATYSSGEEEDARWVAMHHKDDLQDTYGVSSPTETMWRNSEVIEAKQDGRFVSPGEAAETGEKPKTRELRVKQWALDKWTRLGAEGGSYRYKAHRRELVRTGEPQPLQTRLCDDHGNDIPDLVKNALEVLKDVDHELILDAIEEAEEAIARREGAEARDQLTSLRLAKETVKRQVIMQQDGVAQLQNAYEIQKISGRVSFRRGGPQGLMGEVKAKVYDLENYRNFDIKSCHTSAFKQVAKMLAEIGVEIDVSAWERYPDKYEVAARTGLPVGLIKVVEHAVKYGAVLPDSMEQVRKYYVDEDEDSDDRSNWPCLAKEVKEHEEQGLIDDADEAFKTLNAVFGEMREVVIEMADALLNEYYDEHASGGWMKNACGVSFGKHTWDEGHEQRSKVMAWMLQGLEAAFCHHLTILSAGSEAFSVVANEHDGLIIRKDVDDEEAFQEALDAAIDKAREKSGFYEAEFVEKEFADDEDVEALYCDDEDEEPEVHAQPQTEAAEQAVEQYLNRQRRTGRPEVPKEARERQAKHAAERERQPLTKEEMLRVRYGEEPQQQEEDDIPTRREFLNAARSRRRERGGLPTAEGHTPTK